MSALLLPYEDVDAAVREAAADQSWHDAEYDAWLDGFLSDAYEAWLDDVEPAWLTDWLEDVATAIETVADPAYVPFQHAERYAQLADEIGYAESVTPYLF